MIIFISLCKQIWNNHLRRKQGSCPALSFSAHLKTAMLPHVATCWQIELSALSFLHPAFTRAMALVVLSSSFMWKQHLGLSPVNLGRCLRNPPKTLMSTYACFILFPWESFNRQTCKNHLRPKQGRRLEKDLSVAGKLQWCHMLADWTHSTQFSPPCIPSSDGFSYSFEFFCLKIALLLVNSKSWALLAQPHPCFGGKALVGKLVNLHTARLSKTRTLPGNLSFTRALASVVLSWAGLGRILGVACATTEKHWCRKAFLGKPHKAPLSKIMTLPGKDFVFLCTSEQLQCCYLLPHVIELSILSRAASKCSANLGWKRRKGGRPTTPQVHGVLQTHERSPLSLLVAWLSITRLNLRSLVSGCTTALYNDKKADNGVKPRTFTTVIMRTVSILPSC